MIRKSKIKDLTYKGMIKILGIKSPSEEHRRFWENKATSQMDKKSEKKEKVEK